MTSTNSSASLGKLAVLALLASILCLSSQAQTPPTSKLPEGLVYEQPPVVGNPAEATFLFKIKSGSGYSARVVVPRDRLADKAQGSSPAISALPLPDYVRETKTDIVFSGGYVNDSTTPHEV